MHLELTQLRIKISEDFLTVTIGDLFTAITKHFTKNEVFHHGFLQQM